jgi:hypothetical protein
LITGINVITGFLRKQTAILKDSGNIRYRAVHKNSKKSATDLIFMGIGLAIVAELGVIIRKLDKKIW